MNNSSTVLCSVDVFNDVSFVSSIQDDQEETAPIDSFPSD